MYKMIVIDNIISNLQELMNGTVTEDVKVIVSAMLKAAVAMRVSAVDMEKICPSTGMPCCECKPVGPCDVIRRNDDA